MMADHLAWSITSFELGGLHHHLSYPLCGTSAMVFIQFTNLLQQWTCNNQRAMLWMCCIQRNSEEAKTSQKKRCDSVSMKTKPTTF